MYIMSELWQRIRQARRYADQTQAQLAVCCGVSRAAVAQWESAEPEHRTKPSTEHVISVSKCTGVPLEWLLNDASELNDVWRMAEFTPGRFASDPIAPPPPAPTVKAAAPAPDDVIPDLQQDGTLYCFAQTPEQIAAKVRQLAGRSDAHLVLIGVSATVTVAPTPAQALAYVVQAIAASSKPLAA